MTSAASSLSLSLRPSVFVALGNPGAQYRFTRHNVGMLFFEYWDQTRHLNWKQKFKGLWAEQRGIHFLQPQTYMNLSGESILPLIQFYKISPASVCVLHDEIDLPVGALEFRKGGGLAGHNGLKSTNALLGTPDFFRIRIGVGRPQHPGHSVSDWVLGNFSSEETKLLSGSNDLISSSSSSDSSNSSNSTGSFKRLELALNEWLGNDKMTLAQVQSKYNLRKP